MANTYTLSIVGDPRGNAATGVIQQVAWRMEGTDGVNVVVLSGIAVLPPIDPASPTFIPLPQITFPVLESWAQPPLVPLPDLKSQIDAALAAKAQAAAAQPQPTMAALSLAPSVAAQAMAGVSV